MGAFDPLDRYTNRPAAGQSGSLRRGLQLLTCLAEHGEPLGLSALALRSGLDKATVHRLARGLLDAGYLTQQPVTRSYALGLRILDLGFAALAQLGVRELALPYMRALADQFTGASVSLSVLDRGEPVYIERISQRRISVTVDVRVGTRIPAHCSSMGKALLAALPMEEAATLIGDQPLEAWTPRTITSVVGLGVELARVRELGYAINDEETALGLRSVATAILDPAGRPVAAVNVAVSAAEVSLSDLEVEVAPAIVNAAAAISRHLGHPGRPVSDGEQDRSSNATSETQRTGAGSR